MSSAVEQVKSGLDIVEVVSGYLKLEKAGQNWKARCPFHNEKTASFFVSPARQTYHCFGCNRGGDMISFVEEMEGLEFLEALKLLAERAGVTLAKLEPRGQTEEKSRLYQALAAARDYYRKNLSAAPEALAYLRERGLAPETMESFQLGLAPEGWQNLSSFLSARGFSNEIIIKAGLARHSAKDSRRIYDHFRSRLMFPINDSAGRVVGFSGRIFGRDDAVADSGGKYVNTPETALYNKSRLLYGYDRAKTAIRREGYAVLVEGQFDLLLSHQIGVLNTVAMSGTALTAVQLSLIKRLTDKLIIAFDGDAAGMSAASRSIIGALAAGFVVKVVALPEGQDPAEFIQSEPKAWPEMIKQAKHVIDFLLDHLAERRLDKLSLIRQIEELIYPHLRALADPHERDHFMAKISFLTQVSENTIREALKRSPVVGTSLHNQAPVKKRQERIVELLFGLWWQGQEPLRERLIEILGAESFAAMEQKVAPRRNELVLLAELAYAGMAAEKLAAAVNDLCDNLRLELEQERVGQLRSALAEAERQGDESAIGKLLAELQSAYRQINDLKSQPHHG